MSSRLGVGIKLVLNQFRFFQKSTSSDFSETLHPAGTSEAFRRPTSNRNPVGFGLHEFIRINSLYNGGFVSDDDVIVVKAKVVSDELEEKCFCESKQD